MKKSKKPHPDLHHFTMALKLTEGTIRNDGSDVDEFFKRQADRLRKVVEGLK